jgi:PhnB protein
LLEGDEITEGSIRLGPGTLYPSLQRMRVDGLIEELDDCATVPTTVPTAAPSVGGGAAAGGLRRRGQEARGAVTTVVPEEFGGVTPQLVVPKTGEAVAFYVAALAADELLHTELPDGRVMHCELLINGGRVLVHDEFPESGSLSPRTLGGTPVRLHLYVDDVDAWYARAVEDIAGHHWSLASRLDDPAAHELRERGQEWFEQHRDEL